MHVLHFVTPSTDIIQEVKELVAAAVANTKLKEAVMKFMKPPNTYEKLNDLSAYVRTRSKYHLSLTHVNIAPS